MPLQITGRHMTITGEQRDYLDKKANRLRRMCPKIDEMNFTLTKEKLQYEAEGRLRAGRLVAQAVVTAAQPLEAIDALVDKLEAQISKNKAKLTDKKGPNPDKALGHEALAEEAIPEEPTSEEDIMEA